MCIKRFICNRLNVTISTLPQLSPETKIQRCLKVKERR